MRVVVLGGHGFFGRLIVAGLRRDPRFRVIVAGRRPPGDREDRCFARLDLSSPSFESDLAAWQPDLVIHCAGPFRAENPVVARAALLAGSHYVDLADNPGAVLDLHGLDSEARRANLVMRSGVSSVPALSSAVVAEHAGEFSSLRSVDIGITTPARVPGVGTAASVLAQCGRPITASPDTAAWCGRHVVTWPAPVGRRVMSWCDVPDLVLLPKFYPSVERVSFCAGMPSPVVMWGLRRLGSFRQRGWIRAPELWARPMSRVASFVQPFGNGASGMFVDMGGIGIDGGPLRVFWWLTARDYQGPRVAAQGAVSLAGLIASGSIAPGAGPAFMTMSSADYLDDLPVTVMVERQDERFTISGVTRQGRKVPDWK